MKLLEKEAERLKRDGITEKELDEAKTQLLGDHEHVRESKAASISEASFNELYGAGFEEFLRYPDRLRGVGRGDVEKVIAEFIDPRKAARILVGPQAGSES